MEAIVERINFHNPDICVLTEFRNNLVSRALLGGLRKIGMVHEMWTKDCPKSNCVLVLAREPLAVVSDIVIPETLEHHIVCAAVGSSILIGAFCATPPIGREFITFLGQIKDHPSGRAVIATGDFYFGAQGTRPDNYRHLTPLLEAGWIDVWHTLNGPGHCWSHESSNGCSQPDHLFVWGTDIGEGATIRFSMSELEQRLSDHAPMLVNLPHLA